MQGLWNNFWKNKNNIDYPSWSKRRIIYILEKYIGQDKNVLDLGCGSGFFSRYFISKGCNVYCLDYSRMALELTKVLTGYKARQYIEGDICDEATLAGIDIKFDIIFTDGFLEHYPLHIQDNILQKMQRLKRQGGWIINFVPNRFSLWNIIRRFFINIQERPFTIQELINLHTRNGLKVILYGGINVLPLRFSPEILGMQFGMLLYCIAQ